MSRKRKLPSLVPEVKFPWDFETDDRLHDAADAAITARDPRARAEAELALAHRAMVKRDAALYELVRHVQQRDADDVGGSAADYAFWHARTEMRVRDAGKFVQQARDQAASPEVEGDAEAER
jgi:hypothetical protein